ncbi:phosphatase PAP2 family protein [Helicobacter sp. MIT 05-5293]|uniref:phosphatase PAP2 family protein n=1 Tax=Helicobacter sp. MIT 05-5293 TaxID=1548149 RepID=UPI00051CE9DA|nr:phosphatase PAP2 family protein [Helicobacter sp. MIT 05-5293]TLD80402.1 phosphatase PAP2 family protein [Helicobacter sp. MIT 05-5293]
MYRIITHIAFVILLSHTFFSKLSAKSGFEIYGDVMQVLPVAMMAYSWYLKDYQGIKEQAIGAGVTLVSTHIIKEGFVILSRSHPSYARISQRPNNGSFNGFPSGHTSWTFSSVGFSLKRYGWKLALPTGIIATSVGISRIYAERHTTTQVIAGAILGFGTSYLIASKYQNPTQNISFYTDKAFDGTPSYHFQFIKRF